MKWVFLLFLMVLTPALAAHLKSNPKHVPWAALFLGMLPFIESRFNVSASPISWPTWPGAAKGIDLSLTDAVALAILVASRPITSPTRTKIAFGLYALAFIVSTAVAETKMPTLFYGWQVLRGVLVFLAVARATATNAKVPIAVLTGLIIGIVSQAIVVTLQHASGVPQAGGWFGHQNLLGMVTHFVTYPAFALFLGGYYPKRTGLAVVCALIIAYAGGSRATIGLIAAGLILTAVISSWHRMTGRKGAVAVAAVLGLLVLSPLLFAAVGRRSEQTRADSTEERKKMMAAASMMIADHPLGVGANRYVVVANLGGYSARAGVPWTVDNRAAPVHNTYYLVTAEMGWFGLVALLSLIGAFLTLAVSTLRKASSTFESEYVAGITVTLMLVAVHAYFEWVTVIFQVQTLFAITAGLLVGLRVHLARKEKRTVSVKTWAPKPDPAVSLPHAA